ncbi:MAG: c-type cytochrome [bacterium]|nr:c-type cytochrome [bacterium]
MLIPLLVSLAAVPQAAQDPPDAVPAQYLLHCAACHGERGDGEGTTELDRKPRSFVDGGFSYGNTQAAIYRSLTHGIPGTPMPAFDAAMSEDERVRMAEYVISLGPERRVVDPKRTVMVVADRPLIVRGMLPAIVPGAKQQPRGLLIGTTSGATFEYRVDDVRLLGVRQGDFVERRDWTGRGGNALKPLGKLVYLCNDAEPGPTFRLVRGEAEVPLTSKMKGTFVREGLVGLEYVLVAGAEEVAHVEEAVRSIGTSVGAGFGRRFLIEAIGEERTLRFDSSTTNRPSMIEAGGGSRGAPGRESAHWAQAALERPDGLKLYIQTVSAGSLGTDTYTRELTLAAGTSQEFDVATIVLTDWNPEIQSALEKELSR